MSGELTLPRGWSRFTIDDIAESIQYGHTASATDDASGPRFLRISDIQDGRVDWSAVPSCDIDAGDTAKYLLQSGDLVFARTGATTGKSFLIRDCPRAVFASYLIRLRMRAGTEPAFVAYFFQSLNYWRQIEVGKRGIGQPNVNGTILGRVTMPLAPLPEQRRIVAKIEELFSDLDAGVAALERARGNLKRYRAAVLKAAVEGRLTEEWRQRNPVAPEDTAPKLLERILAGRRARWKEDQLRKIKDKGKPPPKGRKDDCEYSSQELPLDLDPLPAGWSWSSIDRIADVQGGIQKQPKRAPVKNAYPYLRVANVHRDRLDLTEVEKFELFPGELERLRLEPNDLLIVEGNGSRTEIGRSAIWRGEIPDCVHQNHIIRVRSMGVSAAYVNLYWNSPDGSSRVMTEAASTSGLYTLSVAKVRRLPVPLPPLAEQSAIVAEVDRRLSVADAAEQQVEHALHRAARLRQSILKRAFEGTLVPQDPAEKPGAAMLDRIMVATNGKHPAPAKPSLRRSRTRV